ncbi:hypothetical protein HanOQP8_Chr09g0335481 [Helianthus annuus]|nr:hypothetical protein HanOQP8_Chr09g0335481 [Helianthus annuus]
MVRCRQPYRKAAFSSSETPDSIVVLHQALDIRHITLNNRDKGRLVHVPFCLSDINATT